MLRRTSVFALLATLALMLAGAGSAVAAPAVSGEFSVPGLGSNNKIVQGPDGNMWVTLDGNARDVARITPDGVVKEFNLGAVTPLGITVGPEGLIWIARNGGVISFNPADPEGTKKITDIALVGASPAIVLGPDGNLWATGENKLAKIPPANPAGATEVPVPGLSGAKDIDAAGSLLVIADFNGSRVVTVTTAGKVEEHKVGGGPQGVAGNPNGQYAFSQPTTEPREFGLFAPGAAPIITPVPGKDPFGVALGSDLAYWAPEFNSDGLLRMTSAGAVTGLTGFAKNSAPRQIAAGPGNTLWVTLEMTKKVGRVSGLEPPLPPPPPPTAEPKTQIDKGPKGQVPTTKKRAKVSFRFSSPDAGATFQCRVKRLAKKPAKKASASAGKKKAPKVVAFKTCKSPKTLKLAPGRYRFEVRAVLNGIVDATPAKRSFRVVRVFPID